MSSETVTLPSVDSLN